MLHLCVRHKDGYEIEVLVNEYTQHIASRTSRGSRTV